MRLAHDVGVGGHVPRLAVRVGDGVEEVTEAHLIAVEDVLHRSNRPTGDAVLAQGLIDLVLGALLEPDGEEIVELAGVLDAVLGRGAEGVRPLRAVDGQHEAFPHVLLGGVDLHPAVEALDEAEHGDLARGARVDEAVVGPLHDVLAAQRHRRFLPAQLDDRRIAIAGEPAEHRDARRRARVQLGDAAGDADRLAVRVAQPAEAAGEGVRLAPGVVRGEVRGLPAGAIAEAPEGRERDRQAAAPAARQPVEVQPDLVPVARLVPVEHDLGAREQPREVVAPLGRRVVDDDAALAGVGVGEEGGGVGAGGGEALEARAVALGRFDLGDRHAEVGEQPSGEADRGALAVLDGADRPRAEPARGPAARSRPG